MLPTWRAIAAPAHAAPPRPLTLRVQTIPARSYFPDHSHGWGQLVYAISGVLTVAANARTMVISPEQAVWLPQGVVHRVGSLLGAEFRSLWISMDVAGDLPGDPTLYAVGPLLRALIGEAAAIEQGGDPDSAYSARLTSLILDQIRRAAALPMALPWPASHSLVSLCEALYADPADLRSAQDWARELALSPRTLTRRFEAETGMSLRSWRRRMRLFKSIELLGGGRDVTTIALDLGYGSASAFIYAFRLQFGVSPAAYARAAGAGRSVAP